jgi:pimeloyl-ACP methyl ester carboxylesterase
MWKDFPDRLCEAAGVRGLVYSRAPNGRSTSAVPGERFRPDYMHRHAHDILPAFLRAVGADGATPPWLFGHSDGGSIALLHAARQPARVSGLIVVAPHIFVEPLSIASIEAAKAAYLESDLRERLGRYHADVDATFRTWNDIWLDPAFRGWNIEAELSRIECPVLALQGQDDQYGTLEQVHGIARRLPRTRVVALPECRHSAHKDQPDRLIEETVRFIWDNAGSDRLRRRAASQ